MMNQSVVFGGRFPFDFYEGAVKEIFRRTLVALWLVALVAIAGVIFESGLFGADTWITAVFLIGPVWVMQFVLIGALNPLSLLRRPDSGS